MRNLSSIRTTGLKALRYVIAGSIVLLISWPIWVSGQREQAWTVIPMVVGIIALVIVVGLRPRSNRRTGIEQDEEISSRDRSSYDDASMMTNGGVMRTIRLSEDDAQQVKAILMTHAEMQDLSAIQSTDIISRLIAEGGHDEDEQEMREILAEQVGDLEWDSDNLRRIADLF